MSPVFLKPDFRTLTPKWEVRNPLDTFPAPLEEDAVVPENCIFTSRVTASWLLSNYGEMVGGQMRFGKVDSDSRYTLLEYVCDDSLQLIVLGAEDNPELKFIWSGARVPIELTSLKGNLFKTERLGGLQDAWSHTNPKHRWWRVFWNPLMTSTHVYEREALVGAGLWNPTMTMGEDTLDSYMT